MREREYKYIQTCTHITYTYIIICANFICRHFSLFLFAESSDSEAGKKKAREMAGREMSQGGEADKKQKKRWQTSVGSILIKPQAVDMPATYAQTHAHAHTHTQTRSRRAHTLC